MSRTMVGILVLVVCPSAVVADDKARDKLATPAEKYRALIREYNAASGDFRKAKTDGQRKAAVEKLGTFAPKFLELAEQCPKDDPIVFQVLRQAVQAVGSTDSLAQIAWEMNGGDFPAASKDDAAGRIVELLRRDHLRSDKLGPVCERMRWGYRMEYEAFLSMVLKTNLYREVQAIACLGLAQFLNDRLRVLDLVKDRPELTKRYEALFGKDYLPRLRGAGRAALAKRIETLFERAREYGDVKLPTGGTVGQRAKSELYNIRYLAIGKPAPNIEGKDQDGKRLKLSDYRGKVVLLYFWMEF